jgi:ABC-type sulfate transport system substrate-binding protein
LDPLLRSSLALLAALTALAASSAATAATGRSSDTTLSIVGYSIPTAVFPKLTAAYQATTAGSGVKFTSSFAASEVQSKAVAAGLPTDIVNFSISTDVDRLVSAGLVDKTWDKGRYNGIVSKSVVVFVLRNGNPKHIRTWDDLVKPRRRRLPEPVQLGRRAVGRHRGVRSAAPREEDAEAGAGVPQAALPAQRLAGHERSQRAQHVPVGQR